MPVFWRILPLRPQSDTPFLHHKYNKFSFTVLVFTLKKVQVVQIFRTTCTTIFSCGLFYPYLVVNS